MISNPAFTIARVIARLNVGGPAIQAILMTDAFRRRGYRTLLITGEVPPNEGSMEYLAEKFGVRPLKIGAMSRRISWAKDLASLWQLIRIFRREKPAIVHTHTAKAGTIGRLAAILAGVPLRVHTFHGHVFQGYFSRLTTLFFKSIERFLATHTDVIVAISESQKQELVEVHRIAPPEKVVVIPLGFDLAPFLAIDSRNWQLRQTLACGPETLLVGWVGRITAIKDPELLLRCAGELTGHSQDLKFAMVGDGELRSHCESEVRARHLESLVSFTGWQQNLESVYADLDLVVLTSLNEGTPVCLLESMASGKAFVATDVGGVRDLMAGPGQRQQGYEVFRNGILVPRDSRVIASAISYLGNNPELRDSMGQAGREFARTRFSSERLTDDLERLYLSLAESEKQFPNQVRMVRAPGSVGSSVQKEIP